jgi:hypothetical protein
VSGYQPLRILLRVLLPAGLARRLLKRNPQLGYCPCDLRDISRPLTRLILAQMLLVEEDVERFSAVACLGLAVDRVNSVRDCGATKIVWITDAVGILTSACVGTIRLGLELVKHWRYIELSDAVHASTGALLHILVWLFLGF